MTAGSAGCQKCDKGYYKNFIGSSPCRKCPENKTTADIGTIRSTNCSKSLYWYYRPTDFVAMVAGGS